MNRRRMLLAGLTAVVGCTAGAGLAATCDPAWTTKASLPAARRTPAGAAVGDKIYVMGGISGANYSTTMVAYDPATNAWTVKAAFPTPRTSLAVVACGGSIYAVGGYNGNNVSILEAYNPVTNTWQAKASMPTARSEHAAVTVGGTIYVIGGFDNSGKAYATVEAYDPSTNSWVAKAPLPTARGYLAAACLGGTIYALGGTVGWYDAELATVEAYDTATNTWTTVASLPDARRQFAAVSAGGVVYAIGGSSFNNNSAAYNRASNSWSARAGLPTQRQEMASAVVGGTIYIIGGLLGFYLDTVEAFRPTACLYTSTYLTPYAPLPGQWITVQVPVANLGQADATNVTATAQAAERVGTLTRISGPTPAGPVTIPPGGVTTFLWTYSPVGAAPIVLSIELTGVDAGSSQPLLTTIPMTIELGARGKVERGTVMVAPNRLQLGRTPQPVLYVHGDPGGSVELSFYDASGALVGTLHVTLDATGAGDVTLDGSVTGRRLGPGIYDVVARGGGLTARTSFAVVRPR